MEDDAQNEGPADASNAVVPSPLNGSEPGSADGFSGLVERLFRHESGRLLSTLVRRLGTSRLDLAEDIVQSTLVAAIETWRFSGIPDNPSAWVMRAALNRLTDLHRRENTQRRYAAEATAQAGRWHGERSAAPDELVVFDEHEVRDDVLRLMFTCCHPRLPVPAQLALILKALCGFSVSEIAQALLISEAAAEKRLTRAKELVRATPSFFHGDLGIADGSSSVAISERREGVMRAIYLLFNEGYHSTSSDHGTREDLCTEALRLATLLADHPALGAPNARALVALLAFHAARLDSRVTAEGDFVLLEDQRRDCWDRALIAVGCQYLASSARGEVLSTYHLESAIAFEHCRAPTFDATDWATIAGHYDALAVLDDSPVVAVNRAIAIAYADSWHAGVAALAEVEQHRRLANYPFLHAARGALLAGAGHRPQAVVAYERAADLARTEAERRFYRERLEFL